MLRTFTLVPILLLDLFCAGARAQSHVEMRQQVLEHLQSGALQEAASLGEKAVSQWPDDGELRHWLGLAYFKLGQLPPAREQLEHARDLNKKDSQTHFDLALVCLSQQDYPAAANELQATVKLSPSDALAHVLLGRAYLNSNRSVQAIDEFKASQARQSRSSALAAPALPPPGP